MENKTSISLNKTIYPLYLGGGTADGFKDWDKKSSGVVLQAEVDSDVYTDADIIWNVESEDIAFFDDSEELKANERRVRARRTGVTTVSARLPDGAESRCVITVIDNYVRFTVAGMELNTGKLHLKKGAEAALIPILYPKDLFGNGMLNTAVIWESNAEQVVSVKDGKLTAVGIGEATITVRSADVGRTACCHVTVSEFVDDVQGQPVDQEIREMNIGQTLNLAKGNYGLIWKSENRYMADVDENGTVTAYSPTLKQVVTENGMRVTEAPDSVRIFATNPEGGAVTEYTIRVKRDPVPLHSISVFLGEQAIPAGSGKKISAIICPSVPHTDPMRWESSDPEVLEVNAVEGTVYGEHQAVVTAKKPGEAVITATARGVSGTCSILVTEGIVKVASISMETFVKIDVDQVMQFHPAIDRNVTNKWFHWLGTDFSVATLDREGNLMGYKTGNCTVYAIADDSLTPEKKTLLKQLQEKRNLTEEVDRLAELLEGTVYARCEICVKDDCNALRNVHVVPESVTESSVLVLWNRATLLDTGDFEKYRVYCNEEPIAETKKLGYRFDNLESETAYVFRVEALDQTGKVMAEEAVTAKTKEKRPVINVLDFGALGNGKRMETLAIQKAIDACPRGGTVLLPEGHVFVSGALFLKGDMTFRVDGILLGSDNPTDYPRVYTKWEGWRKIEQSPEEWANTSPKVPENRCPHASLLNAGGYEEGENSLTGPYNLENLVICGKGQINANGFALAYTEGPNMNIWKMRTVDSPIKDATSRGSALRMHNCKNCYVKDVQFAYAPGWTVHAIYCENITFEGLEVVSQGDGDFGSGTDIFNCGHIFNGDGIDPESCVHFNMFDVAFATGDDAVAIKSGRGKEGNELDKPNGYIRITDCSSKGSLGGFGTGSETAAGSHDLLMQNLLIDDILISGIWLKTNPYRGGITEFIQVRDLWASRCNSPIWIFHGYSITRPQANPALNPTIVRNLTFENVHGSATNELGNRVEGTPDVLIEDVVFRGVTNGGREDRISFCKNLRIREK